ncbi:uncharacterized protein LOC144030958 [Festucalex cinctus]
MYVSVMCIHVRTILLLLVVRSVNWTHAAQDECKDYGVQFERVFSVPGDAAMINCTLASPDVFNLSSLSYEVDWYRVETGRPLRNVSRHVLIRGETLWLLNVTMQHDGHYQCVLRTSASDCYKQSTRLVVDSPPQGECGRPRQAFQVLTVGVTDTLSCPLGDVFNTLRGYGVPASVTWYRGCTVIEDGFDGHVYRNRARLKIHDVDARNNQTYTCTLNFNLDGVAASMSETIQAWVQEDFCFHPQVLQPANDSVKAAIGSRLTRKCQVFVPCIGTVPDSLMMDIFWLDDIDFISDNNSERIFASEPRMWRANVPRKGVWMESVLTISSLEETDFLVNYTCRVYGARGIPQAHFAVLPQEQGDLVTVGCALASVAALAVITVVVYFRFKIDVVLFFRSSFPVFYANKENDGKQFDAYVTLYYPLSCQLDVSHGVLTFALDVLPQVLEKACGYKLFIAGRDCLPGQAMVDSVHDNMLASRRLLLLYGASSFTCTHSHHHNTNNNNLGEEVCLDPQRQHECSLAMHQALIEGTLKVVLVELEEVSAAQMALFPESLRHLRRKQGAVCWWKSHNHNHQQQLNPKSWSTCTKKSSPSRTGTRHHEEVHSPACLSPSSRFWKEIRYHMPVRGKRAAPPERTALLKILCVYRDFCARVCVSLPSLIVFIQAVREAGMSELHVLIVLLAVASTLGHKGPLDTYHVSTGHLLLLKCPIVGENGNVTWTREGASAGATPGVEVRHGFLYFLPVRTSHHGVYSCQSASQSETVKIDFGVSVSTGRCPPVAEARSIPLGVSESLPCKLDHVLRLKDTSNIRWLKDCRPVEREGANISLRDSGLRLFKARQEDAGKYTCLVDVSLDGRTYTAARSIQLDINVDLVQTVLIEPEVIQQKHQVLTVDLGVRVELKCSALVGYSYNEETAMFWIVNGSFADDDPELRESSDFITNQGRVFGKSTLTILRVLPRFLNVSIRCRIQSPRAVKDCLLVQLKEANHSWFYTCIAVGVATSLLLLLVFLLVFFKVDVVLAYRELYGCFLTPQDADWVPYDALVSVVPAAGADTSSSVASDFALLTLPRQLEGRHGYRLFIAGRDDSPGEATHDAMAAIMRRCRRLIIVVSTKEMDEEEEEKKEAQEEEEEKKEAKEWRPFCLEDRQLSYEQKLGLHDALTRNTPTVILLEIDGPPDYGRLPQSLAFIKRRQGALMWRKTKCNRLFWKKLRFLMPAVPASRQSKPRQDLIL